MITGLSDPGSPTWPTSRRRMVLALMETLDLPAPQLRVIEILVSNTFGVEEMTRMADYLDMRLANRNGSR